MAMRLVLMILSDFRGPKIFKNPLAFDFAFDILRAPRRPKGRQDSKFADR
jgi:hypothetical protein